MDVEACREKELLISNTGGYCIDAGAGGATNRDLTLDCLRNITLCNEAVQNGL